MADDTNTAERESFEAWASKSVGRVWRDTAPGRTEDYQDASTNLCWRAWRARASLAASAGADCERCSGSGEDPEGFYDQSRGDAGNTHEGPCRSCGGSGVAASAGSEPVAWVDERAISWLKNSRSRAASITTQLTKERLAIRPMPLYTHPSPPEGMAGWRDIATAPKDRLVDILNAGRRYAGCHYDRICGEYRHVTACGVLIRLKNATHWMPAPPLPASEAKEL